jgi:hypothetical protein
MNSNCRPQNVDVESIQGQVAMYINYTLVPGLTLHVGTSKYQMYVIRLKLK